MNTYPVALSAIDESAVNTKDQRSLLGGKAAKDCPWLGEVNVAPVHRNDSVLVELERACKLQGFVFNKEHPGPYSECDYTFGAGSVGFHNDGGMGLTAAVLVAVAPIAPAIEESLFGRETCELVSGGKFLRLKVGDAFVFNGDVEHAWIANCRWVIVVQSVRKLRKKK